MTPDTAETRLDVRGFHVKDVAARELLETIGGTFLAGYAFAAEARTPVEAEEELERIPTRFKGFAYEGAAMAFAILDALPFGGRRRVSTFLSGRGGDHVYMAYVGVGWAMARLPRFRWSTLYAADPLLRWLVLDGYGFHQAYFRTKRYVDEQFQETAFPWPAAGPRWYARRVIDQGIGRAMWFVGGTDPDLVATMIDKFPAHRRADLYSGAGLAASYAGGADEDELRRFAQRAGEHLPGVAQGCVFAASARVTADLVVPHGEVAAQVFCGMTVAEAAAVADRNRPSPRDQSGTAAVQPGGGLVDGARSEPDSIPDYEVWRQRIAHEFASLER
jgi:hypothetical protein